MYSVGAPGNCVIIHIDTFSGCTDRQSGNVERSHVENEQSKRQTNT